MANKITVLNKKTFAKRMQQYALTGMAVMMVYAGGSFAKHYQHETVMSKRAETVQQAIDERDYHLASILLGRFEGTELLRPGDASRLELSLEREEGSAEVDEILEKGNISKAYGELKRMEGSGIYTKARLKELENRIYGMTEQGLSERAVSSEKDRKSELCRQYLQLYSKGANRAIVVRELLSNEISSFITAIENYREFNQAYNQLLNLNALLETYSTERVKLPEEALTALTPESIEHNYLARRFVEPIEGDLNVGSEVKVSRSSKGSWNRKFRNERAANFPIGSIGKIVGIRGRSFFVKFEGVEDYTWSLDWSGTRDFWKDGKKNVANYHASELSVGQTLNNLERDKFMKGIRQLDALLEIYQQKTP